MKSVITALIVLLSFPAFGQNSKPVTLRSILLEQLHTTHDQKDWFVPIDVVVDVSLPSRPLGRMARGIIRWDS